MTIKINGESFKVKKVIEGITVFYLNKPVKFSSRITVDVGIISNDKIDKQQIGIKY
jgi:hypothetical protein